MQTSALLICACPCNSGGITMARIKLNKTKKEGIYWYKDKSGKKLYAYRYKYYDVLKKRREKSKQGFKTELEAERALVEIKSEILEGNESFVENDNMTLSQWFKVWVEAKKTGWSISTHELYQLHFKNHIEPRIGKAKLNKMTNMYIERELVKPLISKGLARNTVKLILGLLNATLNSAKTERVIKENPITNIDVSAAPLSRKQNYLDERELEKLLKYTYEYDPTTYYTAFLTLALSGIRKGELAGLIWSDIDFSKNTITVNRSRTNKKVGPPKSENGYRSVVVNKTLIDQLKRYKAWSAQVKWGKGMTLKDNDYVFINRYTYEPISDTYLNDALDALFEEHPELPQITPHGLRHTYSSILIANKTPVVTVAKLIGDHPSTVNNVYAHSLSEAENQTVELFNHLQVK